ncbi:MAG TPA: mannose-6-phosphate isomerase, partial [Actinomycetota bacterium]|nr:mannose-6-phosphate isomerase [Actinomycetota bacterium]
PAGSRQDCSVGWSDIAARLRATGARVFVLESMPGVHTADAVALARALGADEVIDAADALRTPEEVERVIAPDITDDPVFGKLTHRVLDDLLDLAKLGALRERARSAHGTVVIHGLGARNIASDGVLVLLDVSRWENTLRMRRGEYRGIARQDDGDLPTERYKRAWFVDWRIGDRWKKRLFNEIDFVIDTCDSSQPKMIEARHMFGALEHAARSPFRLVPYFDPAPWGGQWMKRVCDLDPEPSNYGWCFDCVPEENSLLLGFGDVRFEIPSMNLLWLHARDVLGEAVHGRFGEEFPIRFDFLDTMEGSNLSLQVHPLTEYAQEQFGIHYTQDESYYLLDAEPEAGVYLGVRDDVDRAAMLADLRRAERGEISFPAEKHVNLFPARKHDHFLIPAGTIHCSTHCMVLEISATPYIFTFKLWDWDRPGLDGRPRPIHVDHGEHVIRWERNTTYARERLINRIWTIAEGDGWIEERTGLHEAEFIETRRRWFTKAAPHRTHNGVSVLNLIEGEEALVRSPNEAFEPFVVHYAETFVVPAAAGPFTVEPYGRAAGTRCGTIEAYVRTEP